MANEVKSLVRGQLTASAATYYTATNVNTQITGAVAMNNDATARTVTVHIVASGGTADATNKVVNAKRVAAGRSVLLPELVGQVVQAGATLQALADSAAQVTLSVSGVEQT